eukprot:5604837-Pyramimonas_sp.AAC.1
MSRDERVSKVARLNQWSVAEHSVPASESQPRGDCLLTSLPEALLVRVRVLVTGQLDARDLASLTCAAYGLKRVCEEAACRLADVMSNVMWQLVGALYQTLITLVLLPTSTA